MSCAKAGLGLGILVGFLAAPTAQAESGKPSRAEVLFREGREAVGRNDMVTACAKFEASVGLARRPGPLLNLADCEERAGHLVSASKMWREVIQGLSTADDRLTAAKQREADLMKKLPMLSIRVTPLVEGTRIEIDGVAVPVGDLDTPQPVDPGNHKIIAKAGSWSGELEVSIAVGEKKEVRLTLEEKKGSSGSGMRTVGFVAGGVGVLGIVGFGVTAGLIQGYRGTLEKECNADKLCTPVGLDAVASGKTVTPINTAALIVGVVGLSAGITLVLLGAPKATTKPTAALRMIGTPSGLSAGIVGTF